MPLTEAKAASAKHRRTTPVALEGASINPADWTSNRAGRVLDTYVSTGMIESKRRNCHAPDLRGQDDPYPTTARSNKLCAIDFLAV
ncbi:MAG: hypothetical protein EBY29_07240 [Planctomycetes bacterium]|jgi:hypothetical protein|nr:hypothetical protein [Planctomycetota bacterium]